ncbi:MAG: hypothetical protein RIT52_2579 [Pseudomonadota bacterium]|jgi:hypothetical protein
MRRLLIPALLVNLVSLPAMAQEMPDWSQRAAREARTSPVPRPDSASVSAEARRDRDAPRAWSPRIQERDWRDKNWSDRPDRDWDDRQRGWRERDAHNRWNRDWRDDRHFDWRQYRDTHRPYYRMPHYRLPYGYSYGYRRLVVGLYLDQIFYTPSYWINHPGSYRLPPAYGTYRWVRYFDDVALIDLRNGRVVDVIYDFFW